MTVQPAGHLGTLLLPTFFSLSSLESSWSVSSGKMYFSEPSVSGWFLGNKLSCRAWGVVLPGPGPVGESKKKDEAEGEVKDGAAIAEVSTDPV